MNEPIGSLFNEDKINGFNGTLSGDAKFVASEVAVAGGVSVRKTAKTPGLVSFDESTTDSNLDVNFASISPPMSNDEFIAYRLDEQILNSPMAINASTSVFWILHQFGTQTFSIDGMSFKIPDNNTISTTDEITPANFKLYKRGSSQYMANDWTAIGTGLSASNATKTINYTISPAITTLSQLLPASSGTSSLPITLLDFQARRVTAQNVRLRWQTISEINNKGFEIEMSTDALHFQKIAFKDGAGNSSTLKTYELNLNNTEAAYYRLKQIDFDGTFSYSAIRYVDKANATVNLLVFPNPVVNEVAFRLDDDKGEIVSLKMTNLQGLIVYEAKGSLDDLGKMLSQKLTNWPNGIYFIEIRNSQKTFKNRFVLTH